MGRLIIYTVSWWFHLGEHSHCSPHVSDSVHIADLPLLLPARKDLMIHSTSGETSSSAKQDSRTLCQVKNMPAEHHTRTQTMAFRQRMQTSSYSLSLDLQERNSKVLQHQHQTVNIFFCNGWNSNPLLPSTKKLLIFVTELYQD